MGVFFMRRVGAPVAIVGFALLACKQKSSTEEAAPAESSAVVAGPCSNGFSQDPSRAELKPALTALEEKQYDTAEQLLENMRKKYANSSTVRVWRAETALFNEKKKYKERADEAIPFYQEAETLHDKGCKLPESAHYYLRIGLAFAHLRKNEAAPAKVQLDKAKSEWSNSAEIFYNLARAECALGNVEPCANAFEQCLKLAKSLQRPKFLRNHNSLDDWIRRSRTQSEFPALRKDARYASIIKEMKQD